MALEQLRSHVGLEPAPALAPADSVRCGWLAELELELAAAGDRTFVAHKRHAGPLCLQKPFYPGDGFCHIYVLHPPGGLAGGDSLELTLRVGEGAKALVTTPASTKFYRSLGQPSRLNNRIHVASGSALEWLPSEAILFGGSLAETSTRIELETGASFVGWEATALGRPLSGDHFRTGRFEQRLEIRVDGSPLLLERLAGAALDTALDAAWGWSTRRVVASLLAYPADTQLLAAVRERLASDRNAFFGATLIDGLFVLRALGRDVQSVRRLLESSWAAIRPVLLDAPAISPRIWKT
jgi:urease accessory protein